MTLPVVFAECSLALRPAILSRWNVARRAVPNRCSPRSSATEALARAVDRAYMRWAFQLGPTGSETCRLQDVMVRQM
jgi:hypothetical protein